MSNNKNCKLIRERPVKITESVIKFLWSESNTITLESKIGDKRIFKQITSKNMLELLDNFKHQKSTYNDNNWSKDCRRVDTEYVFT